MKTSSLLASRKGADKALSLSLQAYSFSSATTNYNDNDNKDRGVIVCSRDSLSSLNREASPAVVVVQGDVDEDENEIDDGVEKDVQSMSVPKLRHHQDVVATRAKSSPTTPVTAHHQIPNMVRFAIILAVLALLTLSIWFSVN